MARMLDRDTKFRVVGVAVLAAAVMAGVVASALIAKSHASDAPGATGRPKGTPATRSASGRSRDAREIPEDCRADPASPPALRFVGLATGDLFDLGAVKQGVQIEREVTVRNAGSGDLCVLDVAAGCGCVKVSVAGPPRVKPGETTRVKVVVHTEQREGVLTKEVSVWSNDPQRREAKFNVRVDVRLGVVAEKNQLYFGRHAVGVAGTDVIRLRSPKTDAAWTVTEVNGIRSSYTFEVKDVEPNDPEFRHLEVRVTHPAHAKAEYLDDQVTIHTTHPDRLTIVLRSQMMVMDKFYSSPQKIVFGFVGGRSPPSQRQAYVMSAEPDVPFALRRVHVEGAGFEAVEPQKSPQGFVIDVRYDGKARAAGTLVEATLVLEVDDPSLPPMRIPISATVR